ncbi:MAG: hypothetical protein Q8P41_27275 [Pseudomonadota bacterium]|nr:hypothetical protein [Pseudomonadota bacterium]
MQPLPSTDPARLAEQLDAAAAAGQPTRRYVRAVLADVWRAVHLGDPAAIGRWRAAIARFGVDARAQEDVRRLDEVLEVAGTALRDGRVGPAERRLAADLQPILQVLWEHRGEPLSRADLFRLLGDQDRWSTPNTLSYPLEQLADAELVLLTTRTRQGGAATRHYALSALGVRACVDAGLVRVAAEEREPVVSAAMRQLRQETDAGKRFDLPRWRIPAHA